MNGGLDRTAPALETTGGAVVVGDTLVLTYKEDLDEDSTPATSAYTVTVAGAARTVSDVDVSDETVTLTLSSAVNPGQSVAVSYVKPSTNPVQDLFGNDAAALTNQAVTNNTTATITNVEVTSTPQGEPDTYWAGERIEFTVTFSHAVEVSGSPPHFEFALSEATEAAYQSGSGTTELVFAYTVQAGDRDNNGIWIGNQSKTIKFDSGEYIRALGTTLDADLTHSQPGTQTNHKVDGSISINDTTAPALETTGGAVVVGDTLVLTYDEDLDEDSTPAASAYSVTVAGAARTVSDVDVSDETVTLTLSSAVTVGQSVTVSYVKPSTNPVQDLPGNDAAALTNQAVANNTPATVTKVEVTSDPQGVIADTYVAGETIEITVTFSHAVEVSESPPHFEFDLRRNTQAEAVYFSGSGTTALVFTYTVQAGDRGAARGIRIRDHTKTIKFDSGEFIRNSGTPVDADLTHSGTGLAKRPQGGRQFITRRNDPPGAGDDRRRRRGRRHPGPHLR